MNPIWNNNKDEREWTGHIQKGVPDNVEYSV